MRAVVTGGGVSGVASLRQAARRRVGRAGDRQFHHRAKGNLSHLADNKKFKFQKADVSKPLKVAGQVGYVLHFASPASPPDT